MKTKTVPKDKSHHFPTRIGKIARLSFALREEINAKLLDGQSGREIVTWLNTLPEVRLRMDHYFAGAPITTNNFSEWVCGGYQDFLARKGLVPPGKTLP